MLKIFKQILEFAGTRKELLKKSLFFTFVGGIFAALQFVALYFVLMEVLKGNRSFMNVWPVIVVMAVSIAGRAVTGYISTMQQIETGYGMVSERRIHIGDRIRYIPMGYFDENSVGSLTALVTTTMGDIENIAPRVLLSVISGFLNTVVLFLMMFLLNWQIGLVVFCGALLYLVVTEIARKKAVEDSPKRQKAQDDLVGATLEYIQGMGVVKSFNLGKDSSQTVNKAIEDSCKYNLKLTNRTIPYQAIQQAITRLFSVIVAGMSVYLYLNGSFSLILCFLILIASFMIYSDLETAGSMTTALQMLAVAMEKVNKVDETPIMDTAGEAIHLKNHAVVFDDVCFSYGHRKILDHVSISMPEGTTTAIVGPSGSGKTTLCNLIARFWDVDSGKITIGDIDIRNYKLDSLMKNISMVFQDVYLFSDTIENNIKFGCPDATHEQVVEAAKKAYCHDFISALPDGYNTVIGEGGGTLSGGEKQRISIARAMLKNAPIIILDEATSSVDPENEDELQRAIEALTHDKTIIMIAHRLKTVRNADQILVLDNAHIVQRGTQAELIQQKGLYADFVSARQEAIGWKLAQ